MTYDTQGWKDDKFLLGSVLIGTGPDERVNLTPECGKVAGAIKCFNSAERWTSLSDTLFAPGMEARGLSLLTAFAAPLVGMLNEGGLALSFVSEQKHQVDMLYAAIQSAWGRQQGLHIPRGMAFPKKLDLLRSCGHLPCVFPDLFVTDPSVVSQFVETALAQNTVLVSSSPRWLGRDMVFRDMGPQTEERRVLEIPLPLSDPERDAELTSTYHNNFGHTGRKFIYYVTQNYTFIRQHLIQYRDSVVMKFGNRRNEKLILNYLACVGMAAKIGDTLGLYHVTPSRMMDCADSILEGLRHKDYQARHLPELTLRDYIMSHLDAILVVHGEAKASQKETLLYDGPAPTEIRYEALMDTLLFSRGAFRVWAQEKHINGDKILHQLKAIGVATDLSTMRNLRANHPHRDYRGNVRSTLVQVNSQHPLMVEHTVNLEAALQIRRGPKGIYRYGGHYAPAAEVSPDQAPPTPSSPPPESP